MNRLLQSAARLLIRQKMKISICESCTGGMLGSMLTSIAGSSRYFLGGIISYSNEVKLKIAGVKNKTLKEYGAVSAETACEMACVVRHRIRSDIGIGITGIAGPGGGTKKKPLGLVYIAVATSKGTMVRKYLFKGSRRLIRESACKKALLLLKDYLLLKICVGHGGSKR